MSRHINEIVNIKRNASWGFFPRFKETDDFVVITKTFGDKLKIPQYNIIYEQRLFALLNF